MLKVRINNSPYPRQRLRARLRVRLDKGASEKARSAVG
jgi:hypothetical protein